MDTIFISTICKVEVGGGISGSFVCVFYHGEYGLGLLSLSSSVFLVIP